jgi:hypothetical protein
MMAKKQVEEQAEEQVETNSEDTSGKNTRKAVTEEDKRCYTSLEDATKNRPEGKENWFCFQLTDPTGKVRWIWAPYYDRALWWTAVEHDHWSVIATDDLPSKTEVAGMLQALSPADRAELMKQFAGKK